MLNENELPLGLGMALAQNTAAMQAFVGLSDTQQKQVVGRTHQIQSHAEMQAFVQDLAEHKAI